MKITTRTLTAMAFALMLAIQVPTVSAETNDDIYERFSFEHGVDNIPPGCCEFINEPQRNAPNNELEEGEEPITPNPCHAIATDRIGATHRGDKTGFVFPVVSLHLQDLLQSAHALKIAFVDRKHVTHFHHARLDALHVVAAAGNKHQCADIGYAHNIQLVLTDTNRFNKNAIKAGKLQQLRGDEGGFGNTAQLTLGRQGADKNTFVQSMILHPQTVT